MKNFLKRLEFTEAFMKKHNAIILSQEAHVNSRKVLDAKKQPELKRKSPAILVDAFSHVGPGLCMLCISTVPYTMLAGFKLDMRKLEEWWRGRTVPECLFRLVEEYSICETIEQMRKLDALSVTSSLTSQRR